MNRRKFIKRGAIFVPAIFIPKLIRSQPFTLKDTAFVNTINPPASSGPAYLLSEGFESGSEPSGWSHVGTGVNYNYTTTVLEGAKSCGILGTVDSAAQSNFTGVTDAWCLFRYRVTALPASSIAGLAITDSGLNAICFTQLTSAGKFTVNIVGGGSTTSVNGISAATTYWVKMRFKQSASSAIAYIEFSTTGSFVGSGNNSATRNDVKNVQPAGITFENSSSGNTWIFDHVRVFGSDLGDSGNWP